MNSRFGLFIGAFGAWPERRIFVSDAIIATICNLKLPREAEVRALRAFNKLLWLQNDLISRHYAT